MRKKLPPIHPGEVLREEFLGPMGISQYRIAKDISVPARRINEIVHEQRSISADTALRLGRYFGISPQFWLNLQSHFDLAQAEDRIGGRLSREVHVLSVALSAAYARGLSMPVALLAQCLKHGLQRLSLRLQVLRDAVRDDVDLGPLRTRDG